MSNFDHPETILPHLPEEVREVLLTAPEVEFATLSAKGQPINNPLFYYFGDDGRTIDVATGVAYPAKAERAQRNPNVGLLFAPGVASHDPVVRGSFAAKVMGKEDATTADRFQLVSGSAKSVVLIAAKATVRDSDIQANTDRYLKLWRRYHQDMTFLPWEQERERVWYYSRIWIQCTPIRILWWPDGLSDGQPPKEWRASPDLVVPASDPAPPKRAAPRENWPSSDWRTVAEAVIADLPTPTLTFADEEGFPLPLPVLSARQVHPGFELTLPSTLPWRPEGPACLTFALSATFLGRVEPAGAKVTFVVDRFVGNLPLAGNDQMPENSPEGRERLLSRLQIELERRNQPIPHLPG
jgi:hypothetical protein